MAGRGYLSIYYCEAAEEVGDDFGKKKRQLPEDEAQVVAGGGQERVILSPSCLRRWFLPSWPWVLAWPIIG